MFDRPSVSGSSLRFFLLGIATHGAVVLGLFGVRFNERVILPAPRNTQVSLVSPVAPPRTMRVMVRYLPKSFEIRAMAKLPSPIQPAFSLQLTQPPDLGPVSVPFVATETLSFARPDAVVRDAVFSSVGTAAKALPLKAVTLQTEDFSTVSSASVRSIRSSSIVDAGFADVGPAPLATAGHGIAGGTEFGDAGLSRPAIGSKGAVRPSGFEAVRSVASVAAARRALPPQPTGAQILEKPRPAYTKKLAGCGSKARSNWKFCFGPRARSIFSG